MDTVYNVYTGCVISQHDSAPRWVCKGDVCGECSVAHRSYQSSDAHCHRIDRRISSALGGQGTYSDQSPTPANSAAERQLSAANARIRQSGEDYEEGFDFGAIVDSM